VTASNVDEKTLTSKLAESESLRATLERQIGETVKALAEADEKLQLEIAARKRAEELLKARAELELRVDQGMAVLATEIAERKRAEDELVRGQAWLRSLIDTTQDAVLSINREGRVVLFNPAAERVFGYSRAEIVGRKVNELIGEPYGDGARRIYRTL